MSTPTDAEPQVVVVHHVYHDDTSEPAVVHEVVDPDLSDDVRIVEQQIADNFEISDDVHIVGYANAEGHLVVGYDVSGDNQADVAIIDMDNDFDISDPDLVVNRAGDITTIGDLMDDTNPYQQVMMEEPDATPDMSDNNDLIMTEV